MHKKSFLVAAIALGCVAAWAGEMTTFGLGFDAPEVNGKSNIPNPARGEIILDSSDTSFWGYNGSGWSLLGAGSTPNLNVATKTSAYAATTSDDVIFAHASSAAFTITLFSAVGNEGKVLRIKKTDSSGNAVTITPNGSETIEGSSSNILSMENDSIDIISDGASWHVLNTYGYRNAIITTDTSTSSADTETDVSGSALSNLSPGTWQLCYNVAVVILDTSGSTNSVGGTIRISSDPSNNTVTGSVSHYAFGALAANSALITNTSRCIQVTNTSTTSYKLRVSCGETSSTGVCRVLGDSSSLSLTNPDNESIFWARRIR